MKTKLTILKVGVIFSIVAALSSCSKADLSDDDAVRIIQKVNFSTISINVIGWTDSNVTKDSPLGKEMDRLIREGFITKVNYSGYEPTSKGKDIIVKCDWNNVYGYWDVAEFYGIQPGPIKITSKAIDSKRGIAVIHYEISWTPTEYLKKLCLLDTNLVAAKVSQKINELEKDRRITLKLWDDGWHLQE
jgi:hypothetical protein